MGPASLSLPHESNRVGNTSRFARIGKARAVPLPPRGAPSGGLAHARPGIVGSARSGAPLLPRLRLHLEYVLSRHARADGRPGRDVRCAGSPSLGALRRGPDLQGGSEGGAPRDIGVARPQDDRDQRLAGRRARRRPHRRIAGLLDGNARRNPVRRPPRFRGELRGPTPGRSCRRSGSGFAARSTGRRRCSTRFAIRSGSG